MRRLHAATLFAVSALTFVYFVQKEKQQHPLDKRIRETQHEFTAGRRNLAAGIHQMMGGEVAFRVSSHDILNTEELFSSSPFNPRQYTATGTAFIHYKNATEKDADGETTFPPSKSPIAQYSGWFSPTESPSRAPTKYPVTIDTDGRSSHPIIDSTPDPSRKPVLNPSTYYPTKEPSNKPSKMPTKEPSSDPSNLPSRNPTREPSRGVSVMLLSSLFSVVFAIFLGLLFLLLCNCSLASYRLAFPVRDHQRDQLGSLPRNHQGGRRENLLRGHHLDRQGSRPRDHLRDRLGSHQGDQRGSHQRDQRGSHQGDQRESHQGDQRESQGK